MLLRQLLPPLTLKRRNSKTPTRLFKIGLRLCRRDRFHYPFVPNVSVPHPPENSSAGVSVVCVPPSSGKVSSSPSLCLSSNSLSSLKTPNLLPLYSFVFRESHNGMFTNFFNGCQLNRGLKADYRTTFLYLLAHLPCLFCLIPIGFKEKSADFINICFEVVSFLYTECIYL